MPTHAAFEDSPVEHIVGRQPAWIVRSGISLIFIIMIILLSVTWFIRYPDKIASQITLTTQTPPIELVAKADGRLIHFFVENGQSVQQHDKLALLDSSVNYDKLIELEQQLLQVDVNAPASQLPVAGLGELQPGVNELKRALDELSQFNQSSYLSKRIQDSESLARHYTSLQQRLANKRHTMQQKISLEAEMLDKKVELNKTGLVADTELLELRNRHLDKQLQLEDIDIQVEQYNITLKEIDQRLSDFRLEQQEKHQSLTTAVTTRLAALNSQINQWKHQYLLTAPTNGQVSLSAYWSENQHVKRGETVATLLKDVGSKVGKMLIEQQGAGKVKQGQTVNIELASYPAVEFGYLEGTVTTLSLTPGSEGFMVDIALPDAFTTTTGFAVPFTPNSTGTGQIITQEKRLIERFFDKVLFMLGNVER